MQEPLWTPSQDRMRETAMARFMAHAGECLGRDIATYEDLYRLSIDEMEVFWPLFWDFCGIRAETRGDRVLVDGDTMPGARFFPDARLNFAENLLVRRDDAPAILFRGENVAEASMSWAELHDTVARLTVAFRRMGVEPGDRIAAVVPNLPETTACFLAAAAIGATWSSCSPDFGERGILDRFGQIEPKVLIACDGYYYDGKAFEITDKVAGVAEQLPSVEKVVVIGYLGKSRQSAAQIAKGIAFENVASTGEAGEIDFARLPFDHPLYILFSSGTTGIPKCIVHSAGGVLLKHLSEQVLHCDIRPGDRVFYFSTCGWMMWNWLMTCLACEATLVLYDGSPFAPSERALFDYADAAGVTLFGVSAKYIDAVKKTGWRPRDTHDLGTVRAILSTGSPLAPESFDFVYEAIKPDVHLASISGGTDICGCFVGGNPVLPVWRGEIQCSLVGMASDVYDETGQPLPEGKGELVCIRPFPSMPIMFWNDPQGEKYRDAYFSRFPGIWCHGDFAEWTEHGGMVIHGRSDATLNPGGVRIGTAEIYAQVEQIDEVVEALAIGQDWHGDTRVVLFVRLRAGAALDEDLVARIKAQIRAGASPRHVPARVVQVADIPRTKSGKITELAVRDVVHGREVKNKEALANPEALALYRDIPELQA